MFFVANDVWAKKALLLKTTEEILVGKKMLHSDIIVNEFLHVSVDFTKDFPHILQDYFTGTGAIIWLPQCYWSNPEEYG